MTKSAEVQNIDELMEQASDALFRMRYLVCERLCEQALRHARESQQWSYYRRILLPIQECRRQRRMIAADGWIRLGTTDADEKHAETWFDRWLQEHQAGCVAVSEPFDQADALAMRKLAREREQYVEILYVSVRRPAVWELCDLMTGEITCEVAPPDAVWQDCDISPKQVAEQRRSPAGAPHARELNEWGAQTGSTQAALASATRTAADWFLDAVEAMGNAALASLPAELPTQDRVARLERMVEGVGDHELLHQELGQAVTKHSRA